MSFHTSPSSVLRPGAGTVEGLKNRCVTPQLGSPKQLTVQYIDWWFFYYNRHNYINISRAAPSQIACIYFSLNWNRYITQYVYLRVALMHNKKDKIPPDNSGAKCQSFRGVINLCVNTNSIWQCWYQLSHAAVWLRCICSRATRAPRVVFIRVRPLQSLELWQSQVTCANAIQSKLVWWYGCSQCFHVPITDHEFDTMHFRLEINLNWNGAQTNRICQ